MRAWVLVAACAVAAAAYEYDIVQGDIQVPVEQLPNGTRRRTGSALGSGMLLPYYLWDHGQVRYYIETVEKTPEAPAPLPENDARILAAVAEWEAKTCIRLTRCSTKAGCPKPYIRFVAQVGFCSSPVGRVPTAVNDIFLDPRCSVYSVTHEIGHSLGLFHEQSRNDRDEYVTIDTAEIMDGLEQNFDKYGQGDIGPYDYSSIMHYPAIAFAKASKPTIISPQPIGARAGLSAGDVAAIDFMYHGCKAAFAAPTCVASVDVSAAHVIPHTHAWTVDFQALYDKDMTVTYPLTTAPAARVEYTTASGNSLGNAGFARVKFTPSAADGGKEFDVSATFTGSDGPAVTCSVKVVVASTDTVCFGLASNDPKVCSGRGVCGTDPLAPCTCESGYGGLDCSGFATCPSNYQWSFDTQIDEGTWKANAVLGPAGATADFFAAGGRSLKVGDEADAATRGFANVHLVGLSKPARVSFYLAAMEGPHRPEVSFNRWIDGTQSLSCWSMSVHQLSRQFVAGSVETGKTVETNRFYFIDLRFDWAALTVDLYVDGSLLTADSPFGDACSEGTNQVWVDGNGWVDEVNLWCSNYVTLTGSPSQAQLRAGGATLTLTLVGDHDTWVDTEANRQAVVDALVANVALPTGWNALRATMLDASLVTINGQVLTLGPLRPAPTFSVQYPQTVTMALTGSMFASGVPPASAAHELQFTILAACNRGLHVGYDEGTAAAFKKAGAGSLELTKPHRYMLRLHASDLSQPEEFNVYVRTTDVNAEMWLEFEQTSGPTLTIVHSKAGELAVKVGSTWQPAGTTTAHTFEKVTVAFNWADGTFELRLDGEKRYEGPLPIADVTLVVCTPVNSAAYVDELTLGCAARKPLYALNAAGCVNGASAVTVRVSEGSETLSTADKIAIVPASATDCADAETKCAELKACSTTVGVLTKVLHQVLWAAGTLPADASYKVCYFLASRGNYELLDNTFATCSPGCVPPPYYVSLPSNTCVNDGQHASQGSEQVLQYGTKAECCNGLTPKERRECLKPEVVSEVYPDFEKGRCVSDTLRPAVVHPACGVTAAGANKFVAGRFLKASLLVSDRELSCKRVYGGIDEAAVARCVARQGTWFYVDGMGLVQDDPLVDDPVVYATARTVGSLSACTQTYFPRVPAVMCDTFTCTAPWTNKADRGSIHCGAASDDCTKELCCTAPAAPPVVTC